MSDEAPDLGWRNWAGLIAAPAAWVAHHQTGSDLNFYNCQQGNTATVASIGLVALIVALAGGALSFAAWRRSGGEPGGKQESSGRFIAVLAMMVSGLLSLTIVVQISASIVLPPCFR
jgi:hypothetical protein